MIDLDDAARELTASVADHGPDLPKVQRIARGRQRRRRTVLAVAAVAVLAGGTAVALSASGGSGGSEDVHAGPGREPTPVGTVDVGELRFTVPDGWDITDESTGGCGGPTTVVVGEVAPNVNCIGTAGLRILPLQPGPSDETGRRNDVPISEVPMGPQDGVRTVHLPTLDATLQFAPGVDPEVVLATLAPSALHEARTDLLRGVEPGWQRDPSAWREVELDGVSVQVPADWPVVDRSDERARFGDPCAAWATEGPAAAVGTGPSPECDRAPFAAPVDGVWLLPLAGTSAESRSAVVEPTEIAGTAVHTFPTRGGVLEVAVPQAGVLVRIGLGEDGHVAGSILASIRWDGTTADSIALTCGPVVTEDRTALDLPEDLEVDVAPGMGGTGTTDARCAVNLTSAADPGRHLTFLQSGLAGDADRTIDGPRPVRWGEVHDGLGAEIQAVGSDERISILAYGVTEAEFEAFLRSLASH